MPSLQALSDKKWSGQRKVRCVRTWGVTLASSGIWGLVEPIANRSNGRHRRHVTIAFTGYLSKVLPCVLVIRGLRHSWPPKNCVTGRVHMNFVDWSFETLHRQQLASAGLKVFWHHVFLFGNKYTAKELHWVECFCLEKNPCRVLSYCPARPDPPFIRWRKVATASMQQLSASLGLPRLLEKRVLPTWVVKFQILWDIILNDGYLCLSQVAISMAFLFVSRSMSQTVHVSQKDLSMKNTWTGDLDLIYNAG